MLAARTGVKATLLVGLAGIAVTTFVFSLVASAWLLDTMRFLQGASSACAWTGAFAWLVTAAPVERRARLLGTAMGAAVCGGLLGPVLGALASLAGTAPAFGCVGAAAVGLAVWAWRTPAPGEPEKQPVSELLAALSDRRMLLSVWFVLLPGLLFGVLSVLAPLELSRLGFSAVAIGAIFLTAGLFEAGLSPTLGRLIDRVGPLLPIQVALVAAAVLSALLPWPDGKWILAVLVVLTGLCFGGFWVPGFALLTERAEERGLAFGYGFALMNIAWAPGQGGGAALGGLVAGATSDAVPYLALTVACVVSLLVVRRAQVPAAAPSKAAA
jgi:MFS family permease